MKSMNGIVVFTNRKFSAIFLILLIGLTNISVCLADMNRENQYRLGSGDVIAIVVYNEPDLSLSAKLSENGRMSYPFVGQFSALGMTTSELASHIKNELSDGYLVSPMVTVNIVEYRKVFVLGAVNKPGAYPYQPYLNVRQAIALAGGFHEKASESKIVISPKGGASGKKAQLSDPVSPGDSIVVGESFF